MPRQDDSDLQTPSVDWGRVMTHALAGDRVAYARLARLVTGHLGHWRAFDFRPDWDDIVQDVLLSTVSAFQEGRLGAPGALPAYVRQATRFKFIDRIRAAKRRAPGVDPEAAADRGAVDASWPPEASLGAKATDLKISLKKAIEKLPERERESVYAVHVMGQTYDEASAATRIPLGTLKRALREGLALLREGLHGER